MESILFPALATAALGLSLAGCSSNPTVASETATAGGPALTNGPWRGVLAAQGQEIPFLFEVKTEADKPVVYLINKGPDGEKRLRCYNIISAGDSTTIRLHATEAALVVRTDGPGKLKGWWVKYDSETPSRVPLAATAGEQPLFPAAGGSPPMDFRGTWRATFRSPTGGSYPATATFAQTGSSLTGAFLAAPGNYRYLSGGVVDEKLHLSMFDGNQAVLFTARNGPPEPIDITKEYAPNTLFGDFYSGMSGHETWTAVPAPGH